MAKGVINLQKESGGVTKITSTDGTGITELVLPESGNLVSVDTAVTDNAIARYDGTSGKLQNSGVIINDNGDLGVGTYPTAKLSTLTTNNNIVENIFMAGILGVTDGFTISKDSVANPKYIFHTTSGLAGLQIDSSGNVLLKAGTGALGYGTGAGGTVTQLTSKSTQVVLNKPTGRITMNNAALGAGATVAFILYNGLIGPSDTITLSIPNLVGNDIFNYRVTYNLYNGGALIFVTNVSSSILSEAISINFNLHKGATS